VFSGSTGSLSGARRHPLASNRDVLTSRRVFILPSRVGAVFALVLVAMLLGAVNYGNSLAYALTFLLASMTVVSTLHTYRNLRRLEFQGGACRPVFQGESGSFPVSVTNPGTTPRFALSVANIENDESVFDLEPCETREVILHRPARRRGWLSAERLTVSSRYPLGLFRAWAYVDLGQRCLVYPAPAARSPAAIRAGGHFTEGGVSGDGSDDFAGFRRYQPGDSLRHVHWKGLARNGQVLTKHFEGESGEEIWLSYDRLRGDPEQRLGQLCRMVLDAQAAGDRYGLELPGQRLEPGNGETHRRRCLKALALFGKEGL